MLCYSARRGKEQAAAAAADAASGGGDCEANSAPAGVGGGAAGGAAGGAGAQAPLSLEGLRALLLQHVPVAVADLRKRHAEAEQPEARRALARRLLLELLLRFCICAYGERAADGCMQRARMNAGAAIRRLGGGWPAAHGSHVKPTPTPSPLPPPPCYSVQARAPARSCRQGSTRTLRR